MPPAKTLIILFALAAQGQIAFQKVEVLSRTAQHNNRSFTRIDFGFIGSARGYIAEGGARGAYFTSAPEFVFVQTGSSSNWQAAELHFEAAKGIGLALILPEKSAWNGKLYFTAHGAGVAFHLGNLKPWNTRTPQENPLADLTRYEQLMLEKGYALAKSYRSTDKQKGDCDITLDNGARRAGFNMTETPHLLAHFAKYAQAQVTQRLGAPPTHTYWYGHSAGARVGRLINYIPDLNKSSEGKPLFDGFLLDDSASGLWLPILYRDGQDILFAKAEDKAAFTKQFDITHLLYNAVKDEPAPAWVSESYLMNKRRHTQILVEKGLAARHRYYEVEGISHSEAATTKGDQRNIPLWKLMDSFIDRLDEWATQSIEPPANRSGWKALNTEPAIALPEIACPLGVYYQYPQALGPKGIGHTGFASFDDTKLEPLDGRGVFVDMNRNGYWDQRETAVEAWRRLGLLAPGAKLGPETYKTCLQQSLSNLVDAKLLSPIVANLYTK